MNFSQQSRNILDMVIKTTRMMIIVCLAGCVVIWHGAISSAVYDATLEVGSKVNRGEPNVIYGVRANDFQ